MGGSVGSFLCHYNRETQLLHSAAVNLVIAPFVSVERSRTMHVLNGGPTAWRLTRLRETCSLYN